MPDLLLDCVFMLGNSVRSISRRPLQNAGIGAHAILEAGEQPAHSGEPRTAGRKAPTAARWRRRTDAEERYHGLDLGREKLAAH